MLFGINFIIIYLALFLEHDLVKTFIINPKSLYFPVSAKLSYLILKLITLDFYCYLILSAVLISSKMNEVNLLFNWMDNNP